MRNLTRSDFLSLDLNIPVPYLLLSQETTELASACG
jgi:hypothetical protein